MRALVGTAAGTYAVDLETEEVEPADTLAEPSTSAEVELPRLVAAAASGSAVVAAVATKPPLAVSHDAGQTWRESGRGLPAIRAVAVANDDPDLMVAAARNRLYVSRDGGRFWHGLAPELPEIRGVAFDEE